MVLVNIIWVKNMTEGAEMMCLWQFLNKFKSCSPNFFRMYDCSLKGCYFKHTRHREYIRHLAKVHRRGRLLCQFRKKCLQVFYDVGDLYAHVKSVHFSKQGKMNCFLLLCFLFLAVLLWSFLIDLIVLAYILFFCNTSLSSNKSKITQQEKISTYRKIYICSILYLFQFCAK